MKTRFNDNSKTRPILAFIALCLGGQIVLAQDSLYQKGQRQLDNKEYQAAGDTFADLLKGDDDKKDAALYWYAYSQFKNGRNQEALTSISQLKRKHPESPWLDDAAALEIEIQDQSGDNFDVDNEELKLYALNSLMNSPSERSFEILRKLLAGNSSDRIKHRALFVLSQVNDPKSFELIANLAQNSPSKRLQKESIRVLGISGSEQAMSQLSKLYQASDQEATKMEILHSYMVAGQRERLIELAKTEPSFALKKEAVHLIGMTSNSSDALLNLYRDKHFNELRKDILHSIAIGNGTDALIEIINTEKDSPLLIEAIEKMGILSGDVAGNHLGNIYQKNDNRELRKAVLQALFMRSDAKSLTNIAKTENDPALKREALQKLSLMNSDEALQFFDDILNK